MKNIDRELAAFNNKDPNSLIGQWFQKQQISRPKVSKNTFSNDIIFIAADTKANYSGKGIMIFPKQGSRSNCYIGNFSKGKRHGKGWRLMRGYVYIGQYQNDAKHGSAVMIKEESGELIFEGNFHMDKMNGKCFWKDPSHEYNGEINMQVYHGPCTIRYPNGDKFKGVMKNGNIEGRGVLNYGNGDVYDGEFKKNLMHGKGCYTWLNGESYEGEFIEGKIRGVGVMTSPIGTTARGDFSSKRVPFELN
jgi:hypothetical protein